MKETFIVWEIKVGETLIKVIANDISEATEKAKLLLPGIDQLQVVAVLEYFLPGISFQGMVNAFEKMTSKCEGIEIK